MKREVSSLFFFHMRLTLQHTTRSRAQRTSASLKEKEKEKKREKEKDDDDNDEDAEDVVRSAILPKKKKELSCLGLIKFPECDRCGTNHSGDRESNSGP